MLKSKLTHERAEAIAISGLTWLAANHDELERFLSLSGLSPGELRGLASDHGFQAGVLAYLANHEPSLLAFCEMASADGTAIHPSEVLAARELLGGTEAYDRSI
ncbi:MAG: DUF3572 domain-containing protein [Pseudomonadota bacterium]